MDKAVVFHYKVLLPYGQSYPLHITFYDRSVFLADFFAVNDRNDFIVIIDNF